MQDSDDLLINETGVNYLTNVSNRVKEIVKDFNDEKIRLLICLTQNYQTNFKLCKQFLKKYKKQKI